MVHYLTVKFSFNNVYVYDNDMNQTQISLGKTQACGLIYNGDFEKGVIRRKKRLAVYKKHYDSHREQRIELGRKIGKRTNWANQYRWAKLHPEKFKKICKKHRMTDKFMSAKKRYLATEKGKKYQKNQNLRRTLRLSKNFNNLPKSVIILLGKSWRIVIKDRDQGCVICRKSDKTNYAHHIIYKSKFPKLAYNLNNGVELCKEHHREVHLGEAN